jgi:SNF2 family DNA or RNA helicase
MHPDFQFKTQPFKHQLDEFLATREQVSRGLFWEQGAGKTKPILDTARWLRDRQKITGLLVVAPNGVHRNWLSDEVPAHWHGPLPVMGLHYSAKANTRAGRELEALMLQPDGFRILAMTYDGIVTKAGRKLAERFLARGPTMMVLDESHRIKSPSAKRTMALLALGKRATYRRILTGTPIGNGPFDVYTQMKFLNVEFWRQYGLDSFVLFKYHFGLFEKGFTWAGGVRRDFAKVVGYQNIDQLETILSGHASRVLKTDVFDLPPKLYTTRYFQMSAEQWRVYNQLCEEFLALLSSGEVVLAPLVLTRLIRLQQVTAGFIATGEDASKRVLATPNPRLELLLDLTQDFAGQGIIWAKYTEDIDQIVTALGDQAARYDGQVSDDDRARAKADFIAGRRKWFVANLSMTEGLTLVQATLVIYYNTTFRLVDRLQSEDRAHRPGQKHPVTYVDLIAEGTVDEHIVKRLVEKKQIADSALGDEVRSWLQHKS